MDILNKNAILKFNSDTLEQVREVYNLNDPSRLEEALQILENWIEKQCHFTQKKFERAYLERALILSKGSIEKAKTQLDSLCTFRTLLPKYFTYCNVKDLKSVLYSSYVVPLPKMTKDHYRVMVLTIKTKDIKPNDLIQFCALLIITWEYLKLIDYSKGIIVLEDYRNINLLDFLSKLSITELQEITNICMKGYGASLKEIHIVNESKTCDFILQFAKQFVSSKIVSRLKVHQDVDTIHQYVDPKILPVEFGGTEKSLDTLRDEWIDVLSSKYHVEYVRKMNLAKTDETNRLQDKFNSLYMGTPGSFRNLIVD